MMMTESLYQLRGFFRCVRIPEDTFVEPQLITTVQMDKSKNLFFAFIALASVSCAPNTDNNHGLEYDSLEVNFSASKSGDEWANDVREITSWDGSTVMEASFCTRLYGTVINYSFRLQNPIERGNLKVRLICTDGRYQADTNTGTVVERELPYNDGSAYQSPFYFYCDGSGVNAFTWNLREGSDKPETGTNEDLTVMDPEWDWTD